MSKANGYKNTPLVVIGIVLVFAFIGIILSVQKPETAKIGKGGSATPADSAEKETTIPPCPPGKPYQEEGFYEPCGGGVAKVKMFCRNINKV